MLAHVLVSIAVAASAGPALTVETAAPTNVTATTAVLHGSVDPGGAKTTFWFELGTTTAYGIVTNPASSGSADRTSPVAHGVSGLAPGTTYHVRIVASHDDEVVHGADTTFTTPAVQGEAGAPASAPGQQHASLPPAAPPQLGHSIAVATTGGSVTVRLPGAARAVALPGTTSVPVGSLVDTRRGSVKLTTKLPDGTTQTGRFHGGLFQVRQPVDGRGMTELVLRGALPTCTSGAARAAATVAKRPPRSLWGHDKHGRFRTRASNAVITVRGTTWYVADRCDGTLTRVTEGSVAVRDLHRHRTVIVRAGHRYLAKGR
jgi:hypothetical protein